MWLAVMLRKEGTGMSPGCVVCMYGVVGLAGWGLLVHTRQRLVSSKYTRTGEEEKPPLPFIVYLHTYTQTHTHPYLYT